jgi:hypothetical protein
VKTKKRNSHRHAFRFKLPDGRVLTAWAKVKKATKPVALVLTADDVRASIKAGGVGNTQTCSMAVCAKRQATAFPHPVEGYIDWQYSAAFVVTRVDTETGLPSRCVAYHHSDNIARLNDSPGGQRKLLAELEKNGPRIIYLRRPYKEKARPGRARGRNTGERAPRPAAVGANLRFVVAQLGGVATAN